MNLRQRIDQPEIMDTMEVPPNEMKETLRFLEITNKYFGGNGVVIKHLNTWSKRWNPAETISILDIGTGAGDIPIAIAGWAARKGFSVEITAIDLIPEIVSIAKENTKKIRNISIEQKDFFELAESGRKFDYVTASLFLHHIPPHRTSQTLLAMNQLARRGILIGDLHRTRWNYFLVRLLSFLIGNRVVRHDGPLSVRRAFQAYELSDLAKQNALSFLHGQSEPWCRVSLAGEKS